MGIKRTILIEEKSGENPILLVPEVGGKGPRGPFPRSRPVLSFPSQAPTPGALIWSKLAGMDSC